jgi:RNA polymerase sigma factor (sigma-70 family)
LDGIEQIPRRSWPLEAWRARLAAEDATGAWDCFIEVYRPLILATIRHTVSDSDSIMEIFAHICGEFSVRDLARLTAFDSRTVHTAKFSSWLVVVVRHETIDWLRKRDGREKRTHVPLGLGITDEAPLADQLLEKEELKDRMAEELALLKPDERLAIQLYLLDGLPAAEVACVLGWAGAKTVYNCVYRALATLRERLERAGIGPDGF